MAQAHDSDSSPQCPAGQLACAILTKLSILNRSCSKDSQLSSNESFDEKIPAAVAKSTPSTARRAQSLSEVPYNLQEILENFHNASIQNTKTDTVLYLAYGSNLCAETFKGVRGVKPLSEVNVLVPELELTFDLPGIPYQEPCFANTRFRIPAPSTTKDSIYKDDYHKDRWHKGLVGVVYEVTKADYANIIATEGGGASYKDILVDAYEVPLGSQVVDPHPNTSPFKVHTLYCPQSEPTTTPNKPDWTIRRPDPSYAQASARYLKLIKDGAAEHNLPSEYQEFLADLRPYTITTRRQKIGAVLFLGVWGPLILSFLTLGKQLADKDGRLPGWAAHLMAAVFGTMWRTYDLFFKKVFGDGERTMKPGKGRLRVGESRDEEHAHFGFGTSSIVEEDKRLLEMMG